jgi:hypothetical protein
MNDTAVGVGWGCMESICCVIIMYCTLRLLYVWVSCMFFLDDIGLDDLLGYKMGGKVIGAGWGAGWTLDVEMENTQYTALVKFTAAIL